MRSISLFVLVVLGVAMLSGCTSIRPLSGMINEEYIANSGNYEVIGDVEGQATIAVLFGIIPISSDAGYLAAYQDALAQAKDKGATDLIEVFSDSKCFSFLGLYYSKTTMVYAKAIKRK